MKIQILYEENIRNGHKEYTTIDIPDGDYSVMLDIDYEQRLAEAKPEKRAEVKRCETVQEMFDLMNKREYNDWRREHRYIDPSPKRKRMDGRKGHYFINANSTTAPQIVDRAVKPILDRGEVYSGCYARVSLNFYAFNSNGNKGIACGLGNIQKIRDGEPLGGKTSAADDFSTLADDDFLA